MTIELAPQLDRITDYLYREAREALAAGEPDIPDPYVLHRVAESVVNVLNNADPDVRSRLLPIEEIDGITYTGLTWPAVIDVLLEHGRELVHTPGHRKIPSEIESPIRLGIEGVSYWRDRAARAIKGAGVRKKQIKALRDVVFPVGRRVSDSKPGWLAEGRAVLAAIDALGKSAPAALRVIRASLADAVNALSKAEPLSSGPTPTGTVWSDEVKVVTLALLFLIDAHMSWASAVAGDRVLAQLDRAIAALLDEANKSSGSKSANARTASSTKDLPAAPVRPRQAEEKAPDAVIQTAKVSESGVELGTASAVGVENKRQGDGEGEGEARSEREERSEPASEKKKEPPRA